MNLNIVIKNPEKDVIFAKKEERTPLLTELPYHVSKRVSSVFVLSAAFSSVYAQQDKGSISPEMLNRIKRNYQGAMTDKAIRNVIDNNDTRRLALNQDNLKGIGTHSLIKVDSKGITDQKSSDRCWLFTGLNVMRTKTIARHGLGSFEFSQNYSFFWDQLEKTNLSLQGVIDTREKPMDDKIVKQLFRNPLSDGGTFTGVADIVFKYGLVPKEVMPETSSSENTPRMAELIAEKLREFGLRLRDQAAKGDRLPALESNKTETLGTVYRMLALDLGVPPTEFTWMRKDEEGSPVETAQYTPMSFLEKYGDKNLLNNYVMLMNDLSREYYKYCEISSDRHRYDGCNWTYVSLPADGIEEMAIASLKDSTIMYFSYNVGKFSNSERELLDVNNYNYTSLMGTTFGMDKKQRVQTFTNRSSHAMTLMTVDIRDGKPMKWIMENSWGTASGYQGRLTTTDQWFNEYTFRLVIEKKFATPKVLEILKQKPVRLPAWDPMLAPEE